MSFSVIATRREIKFRRVSADFDDVTLKINPIFMANTKKIENGKVALSFSLVDDTRAVVVPDWKEKTPKSDSQFVTYGTDNLFPNMLQDAVKESVSASSVINGTVELFKGLDYVFVSNNPNIKPERINRDDETVDDLLESMVRDYLTYGAFAVQVIYNKLDEIAELYSIPVEYLRVNENRDRFFFSKNWSKYSTKSIEYPAFKNHEKGQASAIYYYVNSGRRQTYGISAFTPVLSDMIAEGLSSKFIMKSMESGLAARFVISLPNAQNLTDEQKQAIEDGIKNKFCGLANAGSAMIYYNNGDSGLELEKIDSDDSHEMFDAISDAASLKIYKALHATPSLFGDPSHSTGFSSNEYDEAYKVFKKMTLKPICSVLERGFEKLLGPDSLKINAD